MQYPQPTVDEIKRLRAQTRLSLTAFGQMLNVNGRVVTYWESGQRNMPASTWELANLKLRPLIEMRREAAQEAAGGAT